MAYTAASARTAGRYTRAAWWRFTRHLFEMLVAMAAGMAVLGAGIAALGKPPGFDNPLVEYASMGLAMSAPMVAWMRRVGHGWADCWEMTASMVLPMYALVAPVALGWVAMSPAALMLYAHVAMVGGMVVLMVYRWDTYADGAHCHRADARRAHGVPAGDPVCGMPVDPATASRTAEHDGATYAFCSPACRKAFMRDPARYLARDYVPSM